MLKFALFISVALFYMTATAFAVKCWSCTDSKATPDPLCQDTFMLNSSSPEAKNKTIECSSGCLKGDNGSISSFLGTLEWKVLRGCYDPNSDPYGAARSEGCRYNYEKKYNVGLLEVTTKGDAGCYCNSDYCNGAIRLAVTRGLSLIGLICTAVIFAAL